MRKVSKLISIAGYCGTGKSTVAKLLANNLPNSSIILGDKPMKDSPLSFVAEFEKIFGIKLDPADPYYSLSKGINKGADYFRNYLNLIYDFMDENLKKEYQSIIDDGKLKKLNPQFIIAEWGVMPKLSLWSEADYRIMVDAPKDERNRKLFERKHHPMIPKEEYRNSGDEREKAFSDVIQSTRNTDYLIYNLYDDQLKKEIEYLSQKIMQGTELNLPL